MAASIPGYQWKLYRNTGTVDVPVWSLFTRSGDISLTFGNEELDDSVRDSGFKVFQGGMTDLSISVQFKYQVGNTDHQYIINSMLNRVTFQVAVFSGDIATTGSEGLKTPVQVIQSDLGFALADNTLIDVTLRPAYLENSSGVLQSPTWETIS